MNSVFIAISLEASYQAGRRDATVTRQAWAETIAYCGLCVVR